MPTVELLGPTEFLVWAKPAAAIYLAAFAAPPYRYSTFDMYGFDTTLRSHAERDGFRACVALDDAGQLAGFTYGFTGANGQWWHDVVAFALGPERTERWLDGCFEYVELAVAPHAQGLGLGARLHDRLVDGLVHRTAALSTAQEMTRAQELYQRRGWQVLLDGFDFPSRPHPYRIMGLDLHGR